MSAPKELVNVRFVQDLLQCSSTTIHRHIVSGVLPKPLKVGRVRLWVKSELIHHLIREGVNDA